jgi:hypothetical protein
LVQTIKAEGVLRVLVKRHSVEMFRLRSLGAEVKSYSSPKDEL